MKINLLKACSCLSLGVTLWFVFAAGAYGFNKSEQRKLLEEIANEVNASAPTRISNELVLTRTIVRDYDELAYVFHNLVYKAYQINRSVFPQLKAQTERGVCSKPDTRRLLEEFGVSLSYVYYDKENTYIGEFTIKPRDCGFWK